MQLNEKQLKILEAIAAGSTTGDSIADAIGSSMQMIRYYLDTMAEDGYLKAAKVYDNSIRDFQIVRAYLTDQGKLALEQRQAAIAVPKVEAHPSNSGSNPTAQPSAAQVSTEDFDQVIKSLEILAKEIEKLPDDRREVVAVYLEDLENELKVVYRRKPQRIKAYFLAFVGMSLPLLKQPENTELIEAVKFFSQKFNISVKLN